jgi:phytoene dehydrogenase-like protein
MNRTEYDAVVIGAGPNGLAAAITLQMAGLNVLLIEGEDRIGGGMRSAELTLPGFTHDICSAIHPMAAASPFFLTLPLRKFGLEYIYPPFAAAHPFDDGSSALLQNSITKTAEDFGIDRDAYIKIIGPLVRDWPLINNSLLGPLNITAHPFAIARFGLRALLPASRFAGKYFQTEKAKGFFGGMAAHSMLPFSYLASSAIGLTLIIQGHLRGWPVVKGGTQQLANALASYFVSLGGKIQTGFPIHSLKQLPPSPAILLDLTPRQVLQIAGERISRLYRWQLKKYRYGMGVYKVDWALDAPIPFTARACRQAGTVHIGNSFAEIAANEKMTFEGGHPENPFVLLAQPTVFDSSRAPVGKHIAWAYCHVPQGSARAMKDAIEKQVERFAPGFRERILLSHTMNAQEFENYNPNYIGGDINGGMQDIYQLFTRPVFRPSPYRTSAKGIYICSSATPPGGGVHGMCGYQAAKKALRDIFKINPETSLLSVNGKEGIEIPPKYK